MTRIAVAYAGGVAWGLSGAPLWTAPFVLLLRRVAPIGSSGRPDALAWALVAAVGAFGGASASPPAACLDRPEGSAQLHGRFLAAPRSGAAPFRPSDGCPDVTVVATDTSAAAGVPLVLEGAWVAGRHRAWFRVRRNGISGAAEPREVAGESAAPAAGAARGPGTGPPALAEVGWAAVRWRERLRRRIEPLYGPRAPVVSALTLARREGLDRELSETFARAGIAHLLAISGFHVGVVATLAITLLRLVGVGRRPAGLAAAGVVWLYVALIGFPDAACRAAAILALLALGRVGGRPLARWGGLSTAFLLLLALDPSRLAGVGFQLSFAGSAGLVAWSRPLGEAIRRRSRGACPEALADAVAMGTAATLATLPVAAWHFGRVSVVGIPMTLVSAPLVALALPGAILSMALDPLAPPLASFLAGGVDALLSALLWVTKAGGGLRWASVWLERPVVLAAVAGCAIGRALARRPGVGARGRRALVGIYGVAALVAWPLLLAAGGWGRMEVLMIDVGQGDALAIRSPRGRWMLVDAGPPAREGTEPSGHPVVRALRSRGVTRLESLVLTHPDLDHIGGARAVLASFDVGAVRDPAVPVGRNEYLDVLRAAEDAGIPWTPAREGDRLDLDGVRVTVLSPPAEVGRETESNETSVVLHVRFGAFDALLTGDAYRETERRLAPRLQGLEVLKVGHHGSDTSTDSVLLARAAPRTGLISVGRGNRYGHPTPEVLDRLERAGVSVVRTDRDGTVSVVARRDGGYRVRAGRPSASSGRVRIRER